MKISFFFLVIIFLFLFFPALLSGKAMHLFTLTPDVLPSRPTAATAGAERALRVGGGKGVSPSSLAQLMCSAEDTEVIVILCACGGGDGGGFVFLSLFSSLETKKARLSWHHLRDKRFS